jgi:hypothetical protein
LLLLGGLLLLAFVPLFYAVATYTGVTLQQLRVGHARALGRAIAAHVAEARERRSEPELMELLRAEIGTDGVEAIGVYSPAGERLATAGEPGSLAALPPRASNREGLREQGQGAAVLTITVPGRAGPVVAVLRVDDQFGVAARRGSVERGSFGDGQCTGPSHRQRPPSLASDRHRYRFIG